MKRRDLEKHLQQYGCMKKREGSNHSIWENQKGICSAVPRHTEIKSSTARAICKQLSIYPPI